MTDAWTIAQGIILAVIILYVLYYLLVVLTTIIIIATLGIVRYWYILIFIGITLFIIWLSFKTAPHFINFITNYTSMVIK